MTLLKNVDKSSKHFDKVGFKHISLNSQLIYIIEEFSIFDIDITVAVALSLGQSQRTLKKDFVFQIAFISAI